MFFSTGLELKKLLCKHKTMMVKFLPSTRLADFGYNLGTNRGMNYSFHLWSPFGTTLYMDQHCFHVTVPDDAQVRADCYLPRNTPYFLPYTPCVTNAIDILDEVNREFYLKNLGKFPAWYNNVEPITEKEVTAAPELLQYVSHPSFDMCVHAMIQNPMVAEWVPIAYQDAVWIKVLSIMPSYIALIARPTVEQYLAAFKADPAALELARNVSIDMVALLTYYEPKISEIYNWRGGKFTIGGSGAAAP